jgi:GAF domain-containing protein
MTTRETRIRTTSTHHAVDARLAAAARLAREATLRHTAAEACCAVVDALSAPSLGYEGIALSLEPVARGKDTYQVVAGTWPPAPTVETAAILTIPLLLDDVRIGDLTVYRATRAPFGEADAALITAAAAHASLGVARARLLEQVRRSRRAGGSATARRARNGMKPGRGVRKTSSRARSSKGGRRPRR